MLPSNARINTHWMALLTLAAAIWTSCCPCRATDADCHNKRKDCQRYGRCTVRTNHPRLRHDYECYAATKGDCRSSEVCKEDGRCHPSEMGECVRKEDLKEHLCAPHPDCAAYGHCASVQGTCVATKPEHCERSLRCTTQGLCSLGGYYGTSCHATTEAQCRQSTGCEIAGMCELNEGILFTHGCRIGKSDAACQKTLVCTEYGRCHRRPEQGCPNGDKCPHHYCAQQEDEASTQPCTKRLYNDEALKACTPDGRCILNKDAQCISLP